MFCAVKRGTSTAGLVRLAPADGGERTWYRPESGDVARDLARFADGDRVIVRVRGDRIIHASAPLTDRTESKPNGSTRIVQKPTAPTSAEKFGKPGRRTKKQARALQEDVLDEQDITTPAIASKQALQAKQDAIVSSIAHRKCMDCGKTFISAAMLIAGKCPPCRR